MTIIKPMPCRTFCLLSCKLRCKYHFAAVAAPGHGVLCAASFENARQAIFLSCARTLGLSTAGREINYVAGWRGVIRPEFMSYTSDDRRGDTYIVCASTLHGMSLMAYHVGM